MRLIALVCTFLLVGCGGSAEEDAADAQMKCVSFLDHYCRKVVACVPGAGPAMSAPDDWGLADQEALAAQKRCMDEMKARVDCGAAVKVESSFERCLPDLDALTCPAFLRAVQDSKIPASCQMSIAIPKK